MPTFRVLMNVRSLGRRRLGAGLDVPLFDQVVGQGFSLLARDPPAELVLGAIGQPWRLSGGIRAELESPEAFVAFAEPGFVKMALNLAVSATPDGSLLSTETRVLATDPRSRSRFRVYWLLIRMGSGAIRRSWLRAIERRALSPRYTRPREPGSPKTPPTRSA